MESMVCSLLWVMQDVYSINRMKPLGSPCPKTEKTS